MSSALWPGSAVVRGDPGVEALERSFAVPLDGRGHRAFHSSEAGASGPGGSEVVVIPICSLCLLFFVDSRDLKMAAQSAPKVVLKSTTKMSLNER